MKSPQSILLCLLTGATLGTSIRAATADSTAHPYRNIAPANVFRLKSPSPEPPEPLPSAPPPKITLQGITTISGYREVLFKVTMPANPPEAAKEIAHIMSEGQCEDEIEVLEINVQAGTARFRNHGVELLLTLRR